MRRRPIGVTLLGDLDLLGAATYAFSCIFSLENQRAFRSMFERLDAGPVDPAIACRSLHRPPREQQDLRIALLIQDAPPLTANRGNDCGIEHRAEGLEAALERSYAMVLAGFARAAQAEEGATVKMPGPIELGKAPCLVRNRIGQRKGSRR